MDLNKAMIIGRITRDPEVKTTPSGQTVASFSVATNLTWTDQSGQKQEKVEFHNVVAWRRLAEIIGQYLKKGAKVYIEGRIQTRDWVGQDGVKRYRTEIIADNMIMLDSRSAGGNNFSQNQNNQVNTNNAATTNNQPQNNEPVIDVDADNQPQKQEQKSSSDDEINVEEIPF